MDKTNLKLVIGDKHLSSWSMRPWLLMKQLEIPFTEELIRLDRNTTKQEIALLSPSGKVPVLIDHDTVVWDSLAICEYLAEKFPRVAFWPPSTKARAWARSVSAEMHSGFTALRSECSMDLLNVHHKKKDHSPQVLADVARIDRIFQDCRTTYRNKGAYLFGEFSIADAMFFPVISRVRSYGLPLKEHASVEYYNHMITSPLSKLWMQEATRELQ